MNNFKNNWFIRFKHKNKYEYEHLLSKSEPVVSTIYNPFKNYVVFINNKSFYKSLIMNSEINNSTSTINMIDEAYTKINNMTNGHKFIFDTETTGLPKRIRGQPNITFENLEAYDTARLVSISWIILDADNKVVSKEYKLICPDGFIISEESINIHGITNEIAHRDGISINDLLSQLYTIFTSYDYNFTQLVAHNINFDINVLRSEMYRHDYKLSINILSDIPTRMCTMIKSMNIMGVSKWPKLREAYLSLCGENITNEHNAEADTYHCYLIYLELIKHQVVLQKMVEDAEKYAAKKAEKM
jgi:DNA polymerase-3 subunit epsilon